jgi:UDP-glucose 4-epimerase
VFGHSANPSIPVAQPPQPQRQAEPATGKHPKPATEGAVLVTGVCGRLGRLLVRELHRTDRVVGVDRRSFDDRPKDIIHHQIDMRRKKMKDIFRGRDVRAVVHLGILHDPRRSDRERHSWNIVAFQKLLDYMTQYNVPKLVVLSGANVYGPQPNNPQFLTEDAPLLGAQQFGGMRDLVELDMLAQSFFWRQADTDTVVLRPCHIVGRVHNAASNYLRLERPVMVMGFDPMMQVVHERDVVRAIQLALRPGVRGIYNIRGPGEMPLSHLVREAGGRPRIVPSPLAKVALDQLWRLRLSSFPSEELDHLRYVCMVDDTRARTELGYEPVHSISRVLRDVRRLRYQLA